MATKDNFNKAVFDMFGVGSDPGSAPASPASPVFPAQASPSPRTAAPAGVPGAHASATYLAPGTYMEGKLKVKGDVEVAGDFKGDMTASGNVVIHSSISSNITAARLDLVACKLTGDIHVSGCVSVDEKSSVEGNLYATELVCAGRVKGDLQITGNATFQQNSKVEGSISTGTMSMERGAIISGALVMNGMKQAPGGAPAAEAAKPQEAAPAEQAEAPAQGGEVVHAVH